LIEIPILAESKSKKRTRTSVAVGAASMPSSLMEPINLLSPYIDERKPSAVDRTDISSRKEVAKAMASLIEIPILAESKSNRERRIFPILMMTTRDHEIQVQSNQCRLERKVARLVIFAACRTSQLLFKEKTTMEVYVASVKDYSITLVSMSMRVLPIVFPVTISTWCPSVPQRHFLKTCYLN